MNQVLKQTLNLVEDLKNNVITLDYLKTELGISVKEYPEAQPPRIVLNYSQIESPKSNPYVMQSRGLILNSETFEVLCLPFDRFFNLGEVYDHSSMIDWSKAECHEKVDGSLIKIYWDGLKWCIATRGTAFAESDVNGFPITFKDLVLRALGCETDHQFQMKCMFNLTFLKTYLFEVTSRENRVVTTYDGYTLWWLGTRCNITGRFENHDDCVVKLGAKLPRKFKFNTTENCIKTAASLPDLQEGYVIYQDGVPLCKIKSPAYVAVHHIKGEGLSPKRIAELVLSNEQDEYLKYFPEDKQYIQPYVDVMNSLFDEMMGMAKETRTIDDQKEFAMEVKDLIYSSVLFQWKKKTVVDFFHDQSIHYKRKILLKLVGENDE